MEDAPPSPSVLVVDDDEGLARLVAKALRREGYAPGIAHSGREALAWLSERPADLILLDLKLQDMGGEELIGRLSQVGRTIPFVVITGQGDERVAVEMMKRGALDYLVKDGRFLEFLPAVVHHALSQLEKDRRLATAEEALKKEHAFSAAVLQTSGAIMVVVDSSGRVIRINRACEKIIGRAAEDVVGKLFSEALLPESAQEVSRRLIDAIFVDSQPREYESPLLTSAGELRQIAWQVTPLKNEDENVDFVIASGLDVTERRRLELEVLKISGREQQRIGQDLHDGLCQMLTGINVLLEVMRQRVAPKSKEDADEISTISGYVKEATRQARMLSRGLSPVEIDSRGLMSALQELAHSTCDLFKVRCDFVCDPPVLVEDIAKATHLYRISQEAISNAIKHGGSRRILVRLTTDCEVSRLEILDDGSGFPANSGGGNGMGLRTMKYRADAIGAVLQVGPSRPRGTSVVCTFSADP